MSRIEHGEVRGSRLSGHIDIFATVYCDAGARIGQGAAKISGIQETASSRIQGCYERILNAPEGRICGILPGEVDRLRLSGDIGIAEGIHRNAKGLVRAASAQES